MLDCEDGWYNNDVNNRAQVRSARGGSRQIVTTTFCTMILIHDPPNVEGRSEVQICKIIPPHLWAICSMEHSDVPGMDLW